MPVGFWRLIESGGFPRSFQYLCPLLLMTCCPSVLAAAGKFIHVQMRLTRMNIYVLTVVINHPRNEFHLSKKTFFKLKTKGSGPSTPGS